MSDTLRVSLTSCREETRDHEDKVLGGGQYRGTCYRRQRNGAALRGTARAHYALALCQVLSHKQNTPCPALLALAHTIQKARPKIHSSSSNNQGPQYGQKCQPRMAETELLSS